MSQVAVADSDKAKLGEGKSGNSGEGVVCDPHESETELVSEVKKKLDENPHMKDPDKLNTFTDKAVESAGGLYRLGEVLRQGAVPIDLIVLSVATAAENFRLLKTELHEFQRGGQLTFEEIEIHYNEIVSSCAVITDLVKSGSVSADEVTESLNLLIIQVDEFLSVVSKKLKDLQSLRRRTADTWLASTSVASLAVGGAAAALTVLSGGAALPVLAPLIAFGAGTTAVATASHVAFNPHLGAQIRDMDEQSKSLEVLKMKAAMVGKKAEKNKQAVEETALGRKKHWWQI